MNTQLAFAFGMLAMTAITMLVVLVVGMVKVIKLEKQIKNLEQVISHEIELMHRHTSDVERNIYSELNETRRNFDHHTEELRREFYAYTDSRIDKAQNKIAAAIIDPANTDSKQKQLLKD